MYKVLILWAPDNAENQALVNTVAHSFEGGTASAVARKAAEATIADINCSDLIVFGAGKTAGDEAPADYADLIRIFKGITFAGRTAGFFSLGSEKATARLRKALRDTEIAQIEDDPVFNGQAQGADIALKVASSAQLHSSAGYDVALHPTQNQYVLGG